jgi:hypothetical protein
MTLLSVGAAWTRDGKLSCAVSVAETRPDRWGMLTLIGLGIVALTLNWLDVPIAFPLIAAQFKAGLGPHSDLISPYIIGYGRPHVPGGMLATAIGMRRTLSLGLLVKGLAGVMSGLSNNRTELAFFRVVSEKRSRMISEADKAMARARWDDFKSRMDVQPRRPPRAAGHDAP